MTTRTTKQKTDSTSEAPVGVVDTEAIFQKAVTSALHTLGLNSIKSPTPSIPASIQ